MNVEGLQGKGSLNEFVKGSGGRDGICVFPGTSMNVRINVNEGENVLLTDGLPVTVYGGHLAVNFVPGLSEQH